MENKRSTSLTVFCILSWAWIALITYSTLTSFSTGPMTEAQIRETKIEMLKALQDQPQENQEVTQIVLDSSLLFFESFSANHSAIHWLAIVQIVLGVIATILMFQLRKIGFHLYIIYSLMPIGIATYFYGTSLFGMMFTFSSLIIGIIFVILYATQLKFMK